MADKFKKLLTDTGVFFLGSMGSKIILFLLLPLYTAILSPTEYGIADLVFVAVNFAMPFLTLSISDSVLRFGLDKGNKSTDVLINSICILIISSGLVLLSWPLLLLYKPISLYIPFFFAILILMMFRNVLSNYVKAMGKNKIYAFEACLNTLILAGSGLVFIYYMQMGLVGYFYSQIFALIFSVVYLGCNLEFANQELKFRINKLLMRKMLSYSIPMIANASFWWIINSSNRVFLQHYWGADALGLFAVASKMPSLLTTVTGIFTQAWIIAAANEYDANKDADFYKKTYEVYSFILFLSAVIIMLIFKPLMGMFIGDAFKEAWLYVPYLIIAGVFSSISAFFGAIYTSAYMNIRAMFSTLVGAIISICINLLLVPVFGSMGAAISTFCVFFVIACYRMAEVNIFFPFPVNYTKQITMTLIVVFQSFSVVYCYHPAILGCLSLSIILFLHKDFITLR